MLRSATTQGQGQDAALKQADSIWRMLDQMAENDPDNYQKFISKHLNDGKEYFALPQPEMVVVTHTCKRGGKIDKRVFINFFSWARVPAPKDPQGAIPMTGGQCTEGISANTYVCCLGLSKSVFEELEKKKGSNKDQEIGAVVGVSMKYLEHGCNMPRMTTNFKILEGEKFGGSDIKNLRKALMESKDAVEARNGISQMAQEFENSSPNQREAMLRKVEEEAKLRSSGVSGIQTTSGDETSAPTIRIPGTNEDAKDKPKKNLIQELKPEDRPLQRPVHTLTVLHKPNANGKTIREFQLKMALPQLSSAEDLEVDVGEAEFHLFVAGFYQTEILFPQKVAKEAAKAKFSKRSKMLRINVPVLQAAA